MYGLIDTLLNYKNAGPHMLIYKSLLWLNMKYVNYIIASTPKYLTICFSLSLFFRLLYLELNIKICSIRLDFVTWFCHSYISFPYDSANVCIKRASY